MSNYYFKRKAEKLQSSVEFLEKRVVEVTAKAEKEIQECRDAAAKEKGTYESNLMFALNKAERAEAAAEKYRKALEFLVKE